MPAPEQSPAMEEGLLLTRHRGSSGHNMEADTAANHILASVKEQELQFERLTRELEVERQIVANQLERCRLGAESPGDASSSSSEKSLPWRSADVSTSGDAKSRVTDSSLSPNYHIRSESEQVSPYCTEQTSLHERSAGNSRTSTQMTSYSDSGYQEAGNGYYSNQNLKAELRLQNSFPGSGTTGPGPGTLIRNARAEGQAAQTQAVPGRAMRRVCSVPSRTQSPQYACGVSPSRGSLRVTGSSGGYASPVVTEPKPLSSIFSTTLPLSQRPASSSANANTTGGGGGGGGGGSPYATQKNSPAALRRMGSSNSRSGGSRNTSPYQVSGGGGGGSRMGSPLVMADGVSPPLTKQPGPSSSSPARGSMTAVPQHYGSSTLPRSLLHDAPPYGPHDTQPYGPHDAPPYGAHDAQPYGPHDTQPYGPHDAPPYGPHDVQPYGPHDAPPYGPHDTQPYGPHGYDIYERMTRPDSLTGTDTRGDGNIQGLRSSYATQMGQDLRSAMSPDRHITPIYEDRTYQGPLYRSPSHAPQGTLYRSTSGVGSLQRTASQRSTMTYQRNNYAPTATYAEPYRLAQYGRHGPVIMDDSATRSPSIDSIQKDPREFAWRDPALTEVIHMLQHQFPSVQANAAAYLQHLCYGDNRTKVEVCRLGGIKHLVDLLDHKVLEVQKNSCGALRNLVYGKALDENKTAVRNAGGVPALLRLLRKTVDAEVRELVTGVLWNLSSCDALKMTIIRDALTTVTNTVIIPHSGWSSAALDDDHKLKFHSSLVLRNTTGCLRNLSSAGEEARRPLRTCEGLVDSLLYVIKACVNTADFDSKIVENCICTLRNLSYRLELEMPPSRLLGGQQLDGLLGSESPSEETDTSCWGRKRKRKKKRSLQGDTWDGVGPIPGFSKPPQGAEMLWHPGVVKPYLTLLAESSNPATLEGAAGSLQNLSAGNWKFAWYIRAAVRKEKGLPILVELLRMDNDAVVNSVATALRNMSLDIRNKELIGKYAMRDLVNRLPGGSPPQLSDETVAAVCCTLHEVTSRNMENAKALADTGGIEKLVNITKTRGDRYSLKVVKAAAQVLNTLWQYRDLRILYKKDGWNQNHFLTPVSTLERDRFKSQPALPTGSIQMSPVSHPAGSATSSPAVLGIKESRSEYQRASSAMQFYNHQGDNSVHKNQYTGSGKPSPFYYPSPTREEPRRTQPPLYYEDPARRNYDTYRMYMQAPRGFEEPYLEEVITYPPTAADYVSHQPHGLKSTNNYVDFYSSTRRRPSYRAEHYPGSPDSWV